jgi:hypothetical protein
MARSGGQGRTDMRITTAAAAIWMATGAAALAQPVDLDTYQMRTFSDVVKVCASSDEQAAQFCRGWLVGNGSLYLTLVQAKRIPQWACADPIPSLDEIRRAIVAYGQANPQTGSESAVDGFWRAASSIWPCGKS